MGKPAVAVQRSFDKYLRFQNYFEHLMFHPMFDCTNLFFSYAAHSLTFGVENLNAYIFFMAGFGF